MEMVETEECQGKRARGNERGNEGTRNEETRKRGIGGTENEGTKDGHQGAQYRY